MIFILLGVWLNSNKISNDIRLIFLLILHPLQNHQLQAP